MREIKLFKCSKYLNNNLIYFYKRTLMDSNNNINEDLNFKSIDI